jgi:hypothetical protein
VVDAEPHGHIIPSFEAWFSIRSFTLFGNLSEEVQGCLSHHFDVGQDKPCVS